jgi:hypothetical protein
MTDKIIALVDGSIYSESVCEHAAWIATRTGRAGGADPHPWPPRCTGNDGPVGVHPARRAVEAAGGAGGTRRPARKLVGHRGRAILEDARAIVDRRARRMSRPACAGRCGGDDLGIEAGARVIVDRQARRGGGFRQGASGLEPGTDRAHGKRPVFVASRAFKPIESVLVAYDGSRLAMKAVDQIARSSFFSGLSVTVVTVGGNRRRRSKGLEDAKALLKAAGIAAETRLIEGRPEEVLGRLVDGEDFGLAGDGRLRPQPHPQFRHRLDHDGDGALLQGAGAYVALSFMR